MSITLDNVGSGFKRSVINDNFQLIEDELNNETLKKDGSVALTGNLNAGGQAVYNVGSLQASIVEAGDVLVNGTSTQGLDTHQKVFSTVAALKTATEFIVGERVQTLGYYAAGDGGEGTYLINPAAIVDEQGDHTLADGSVAILQKGGSLSVKQFGAKGDGVTDDYGAIKAALEVACATATPLSIEEGHYIVSGDLQIAATSSVRITSTGGVFETTSPNKYYALQLRAEASIQSVLIEGLTILGGGNRCYGIHVNSATNQVQNVTIRDCRVENLDNGTLTISTSGIYVDASNCERVNIYGNKVKDITRTQVNPGTISSTGIAITGLPTTSLASVYNNTVENITSPSGDADADGMAFFTEGRFAASGTQVNSNFNIYANRVVNFKGRGIKLQGGYSSITNNYFAIDDGVEVITDHLVIDSQIGGADISHNFIRIGTFTGGLSAAIFGLQFANTNTEEDIKTVYDNRVILENYYPYFILVSQGAGTTSATAFIEGNSIKSNNGVSSFIKTDAIASLTKYTLTVKNNTVGLKDGRLILFSPSSPVYSGATLAEVVDLDIQGNTNTVDGQADIFTSSDGVPNLTLFTISDNVRFNRNLTIASVDVKKVKTGSSFYYATDGGAGGLINAPAGYNRYVILEVLAEPFVRITAQNGSKSALLSKVQSSAYEYLPDNTIAF